MLKLLKCECEWLSVSKPALGQWSREYPASGPKLKGSNHLQSNEWTDSSISNVSITDTSIQLLLFSVFPMAGFLEFLTHPVVFKHYLVQYKHIFITELKIMSISISYTCCFFRLNLPLEFFIIMKYVHTSSHLKYGLPMSFIKVKMYLTRNNSTISYRRWR